MGEPGVRGCPFPTATSPTPGGLKHTRAGSWVWSRKEEIRVSAGLGPRGVSGGESVTRVSAGNPGRSCVAPSPQLGLRVRPTCPLCACLYSGSRVQRELTVSNPICKHPVSKLGSWGQDQNTGILRRHSSTHEGSRNTYIPQVDPRKPATTIRAMPARVPAASAGLVHLGGRPGPSPSGTVPVPASHGLLLTDTPWCRVVWGRTAVIALSR